mmetsp:Transcript_40956/g.97250  ORF Transcript_40956/g.97250 Transcript_40956/m.97250 type:complete len:420 (+) Transcript_40956:624-1883(+)
MCALQSGPHHLSVASAVEAVVHAPCRHSHNVVLDRPFNRRGVDAVSGTHGPGRGELVRVEVDGDDAPRAAQLGGLDDREPDSAAAKDSDRGSVLDLAGVPHGPPPRRDSAPEQAHLLERRRLVDLGAGDSSEDSVLGEGRAAHKVVDRFAVEREARGSVRHHALALGPADLGAEVGLGAAAEDAFCFVALGCVARNDVVAWLQVIHALPHALYNRAGLMPENARELPLGVRSLPGVHVRVAQCVRDHFHPHLAALWRVDRDHLALERLLRAICYHRFAHDRLCCGRRVWLALGVRRAAAGLRSDLRSLGAEARGVVRDVLADVGRNEVVRVVTRPFAEEEGLSHCLCCLLQSLRLQLGIKKVVFEPLVDQDLAELRKRSVFGQENRRVVLSTFLDGPQVVCKRLFAPGHLGRVADGSES